VRSGGLCGQACISNDRRRLRREAGIARSIEPGGRRNHVPPRLREVVFTPSDESPAGSRIVLAGERSLRATRWTRETGFMSIRAGSSCHRNSRSSRYRWAQLPLASKMAVPTRRLTRYAADGSIRHLPGIFASALRG
jgi:hypothetical protein